MKLKYLISLLSAGSLFAASLSANVIAFDYFNAYGSSETTLEGLNGGSGWADGWGTPDDSQDFNVNYLNSSISFSGSGYDNSGNLSGANDGAAINGSNSGNAVIGRLFSSPVSGTVWVSSLVSIGDNDDRTLLWLDPASASDGTAGGEFIGILTGNISLRTNDGSGNNTQDGGAVGAGTYLLLAELNVATGNDSINFWFDPDLSGGQSGLGAATLTASGGDFYGDTLSGVGLHIDNRSTGTAGDEFMDAIRVGTTFTDVTAVPEPSTYAFLVGIFALAIVFQRRRSKAS